MASKPGGRAGAIRRRILRVLTRLLQPGVLAGAAGGLLAWFAWNVWTYDFGAWPFPGITDRSLMPEVLSFLSIDAFVGAGCGFAGYRMGQEIALMLGVDDRQATRIPLLTALMLATIIALVVNLVLTAFNFI